MRWIRTVALALLALLLLGAGAVAWVWRDRPTLDELPVEPLPSSRGTAREGGLRLTFSGVATALLSDGETAVMTDGFFSRPGLLRVALGEVAPDAASIGAGLERIGALRPRAGELAAVVPVHSHYDHAMDSPEVARRTGAVLLGSESSANVARGLDLPEERIVVAEPERTYRFGRFGVTLIPSRHVRYPWSEEGGGLLGTTIDEPLVPPAPATAWKEGVSWSVLVEHPEASVLVQGSAGFVPGALEAFSADVVLLGVGALGHHPRPYREAYYREVVEAVGAELVLPIHFTDFTRPLDAEPRPFPRLLDPVEEALTTLRELTALDPDAELRRLPFWEPVALPRSGGAGRGTQE